MVKIGIIGCGKIAQIRHIPEYVTNEHAELAGFFDLNQSRAEGIAEQYSGKVYPSVQELLADPDIDAVSVCTANHTHAEITIEALQAGKHVLCEKPMATTLQDCEAMVDAANKTNRTLMIGHNQRLTKTHIKAKELIESGVIGDIISFRTTFGHRGPETWSVDPGKNVWFFDKTKSTMGAMADLGVHKTDLIHFLTGQLIVETTASVRTLDKRHENGDFIEVDDNVICIYRLSGGAVGTMTASWTFYGDEDNSTILYGTKGVLCIYGDPNYSIKVTKRDGEKILYDIDKIQTNDNQTPSGVIDLFVDSLIENKQSPLSGNEALKTMRVIFASIESSRTNHSVIVNHS